MPLPESPQEAAFYVNRHGVLSIPGMLWLGFAIMARNWILLLLVGVSTMRKQGAVGLALGEGGVPWGALASQLPVLVLALAAANRLPQTGQWARWVWRMGRPILLVTALANLFWAARLLLESSSWSLWPELFLASLSLLDFAIVLAVFQHDYFRQMFQEFPSPTPSPPSSVK